MVTMRRTAQVVLFVLLVATAGAATSALTQPAAAQANPNPADVGADFDNDGFADLAVGVPGESVGSAGQVGAVNVLYGTGGGLRGTGAQAFFQVGGVVQDGDQFGAALAAGDFNHDGFTDLAAGAPFEDVGSASNAGAVSVLYGSGGGLTTTGGQLFTQNSAGVPGTAERGDRFGGTAFPLP
jgi:FG-GAP repeat